MSSPNTIYTCNPALSQEKRTDKHHTAAKSRASPKDSCSGMSMH